MLPHSLAKFYLLSQNTFNPNNLVFSIEQIAGSGNKVAELVTTALPLINTYDRNAFCSGVAI